MRAKLRRLVGASLVGLSAAVAVVGCAVALIATSAAQARSHAVGHHVSRLRFATWGVRTLVRGKSRVTFTRSSDFVHCLSQPVIRLTANFKFSRLTDGTTLTDTWYYAAQRYAGGTYTLTPGGGQNLSFSLYNTAGLPDGLVILKVLVRGKPVAQHSIGLISRAC